MVLILIEHASRFFTLPLSLLNQISGNDQLTITFKPANNGYVDYTIGLSSDNPATIQKYKDTDITFAENDLAGANDIDDDDIFSNNTN